MSNQLDLNDPELYATLECMEINGGNFAAQLVRAFKAADPANRRKILDTGRNCLKSMGLMASLLFNNVIRLNPLAMPWSNISKYANHERSYFCTRLRP